MVHSLGGTQFDFGNLVASINKAGIATTFRLPGHGGQPEDLLSVRAEDWLDCVRAEYRRLLPLYDTLHVVGMCMGSLLCLELAKQEKHSAGQLVLLAPPVFLDGWSLPGTGVCATWAIGCLGCRPGGGWTKKNPLA